VRIFRRFALGVVLAVDGNPGLGHRGGGEPQPETEEMTDDGMQVQRPMRLRAVQKDGDAGDGDMGQGQRDNDIAPPGKVNQAIQICQHVSLVKNN
jgi:hypothetical protein